MGAKVHINSLAPESYVGVVTPDEDGLDLSTAASVSFEVQRPGDPPTTDSWAADIVSQTADELIVRHEYESGDLTVAGDYDVYVTMTVTHNGTTGPWRSPVKTLTVLGEFEGC